MTLYGISSKDMNNDNIYELIDKHVNLLSHQIPQITHISNEATTFGKRNHFEIWNVTAQITWPQLWTSIFSKKKGFTRYIFHYLLFNNAVSSSD